MHIFQASILTVAIVSLTLAFVVFMPQQYVVNREAAVRQTRGCVDMNRSISIYQVHTDLPDTWPLCNPGRLLQAVQQVQDVLSLEGKDD